MRERTPKYLIYAEISGANEGERERERKKVFDVLLSPPLSSTSEVVTTALNASRRRERRSVITGE
jgi:hypothetical protein